MGFAALNPSYGLLRPTIARHALIALASLMSFPLTLLPLALLRLGRAAALLWAALPFLSLLRVAEALVLFVHRLVHGGLLSKSIDWAATTTPERRDRCAIVANTAAHCASH